MIVWKAGSFFAIMVIHSNSFSFISFPVLLHFCQCAKWHWILGKIGFYQMNINAFITPTTRRRTQKNKAKNNNISVMIDDLSLLLGFLISFVSSELSTICVMSNWRLQQSQYSLLGLMRVPQYGQKYFIISPHSLVGSFESDPLFDTTLKPLTCSSLLGVLLLVLEITLKDGRLIRFCSCLNSYFIIV